MNKIEERKVIRYDTEKMIDVAKLLEKEPELFEELLKDYPVEENTSLIINVKNQHKTKLSQHRYSMSKTI